MRNVLLAGGSNGSHHRMHNVNYIPITATSVGIALNLLDRDSLGHASVSAPPLFEDEEQKHIRVVFTTSIGHHRAARKHTNC